MVTLTIPKEKAERRAREEKETKPSLDEGLSEDRSVNLDCYTYSPPIKGYAIYVFIRPSSISIEKWLGPHAKEGRKEQFSNKTTREVNKDFLRILNEREIKHVTPGELEDRVYTYSFKREYEETINQAIIQLKAEYGEAI